MDLMRQEFWNSLMEEDLGGIRGSLSVSRDLVHERCDSSSWRGLPLIWATRRGRVEAARCLLQHGAHVNQQDFRGFTPLLWAIFLNNTRLVQVLVQFGADVNERNKFGIRPLFLAIEGGCKEVVEILTLAGADVNSRCEGGFSPLTQAIENDAIEIVQLLIDHGANLKERDCGETPLYRAKSADMVQCLAKNGSDVNVQNRIGDTPLLHAVVRRNAPVVKALANHGADLTARNVLGESPISRAFEADCLDLIYELISASPPILQEMQGCLKREVCRQL